MPRVSADGATAYGPERMKATRDADRQQACSKPSSTSQCLWTSEAQRTASSVIWLRAPENQPNKHSQNQPPKQHRGFVGLLGNQAVRSPSAASGPKEPRGMTADVKPRAEFYSQTRVLRGVARPPVAASRQVLTARAPKHKPLSQQRDLTP